MPENPHLMDEKDIPKNWQPIDAPTPGTSAPAPPVPHDMPMYFSGSLAPQLQLDSAFSNTKMASPRIPSSALMPLGNQASAFTNSAAQSTAQKVLIQAIAASKPADDVEQVLVSKLTGTSYTVQDSDRGTLLSFNNNAGGTITLPSGSSGGSSQTFVQANANDASATSVAATFTASVAGGNTVVVIATGTALDGVTNVPITSVTDNKGNTYTKLNGDISFLASGGGQLNNLNVWVATGVTGGASFTVTATISGVTARFLMMTIMEYTSSAVFTFDGTTKINVAGGLATTPALVTVGATDLLLGIAVSQTTNVNPAYVAGSGYTIRSNFFENTLIGWSMAVEDQKVFSAGSYTASMTDTGVNYELILYAITIGAGSTVLLPPGWFVFIENTGTGNFSITSQTQIDGSAANVTIGPKQGLMFAFDGVNWFTFRGTGGLTLPVPVASGGTGVATLAAHGVLLGEGTAAVAVTGTGTTGQPLVSNGAALDPTYQILPVSGGGTGANLSATGGASQVLKQTAAGAAVTVARLAAADLSDTATSGNVLRGNGASFVSAALAAADLSNGVTGTGAVVLATSPTLAGTALIRRIKANQGTALVAGDFVLSAGWGNTAAVSAVTGTDQAWKITVTANGTGIAASPTITLTFKDGTWTNVPITISKMTGGTGQIADFTDAPTATTWVLTYIGTPIAGQTYIISGILIGL